MTSLAVLFAVGAVAGTLPDLPQARAPFVRSGVVRSPVRMEVKALGYRTNLWQGVSFVSGTKRLVISGEDRDYDCNDPIRFGRLVIYEDRTPAATLVLKMGGLWDGRWVLPEDRLTVDVAHNSATWSRPYTRPDGRPAVFSYTVTGRKDGCVTVDYDMGLTQEEALAQPAPVPVESMFNVDFRVGLTGAFGFGDAVHEMADVEAIRAQGHSANLSRQLSAADSIL